MFGGKSSGPNEIISSSGPANSPEQGYKGVGSLLAYQLVSRLVRFHISPEESIDARLIAEALCFEPLQHLLIEPNGDRRLRLRQSEDRAFEEGFPLLRDIGGIDGLVFERINFCPVRPRPLLGSVFLHVCLPFALR